MNEPSPWISVGELGKAFHADANVLPRTSGLAGMIMTLDLDNQRRFECRFASDTELTWREGTDAAGESIETYTATQIRPRVYFVDFVRHRERASTLSMVLDLSRGICTVVLGELPTRIEARQPWFERIAHGVELTSVVATIHHGSIDVPFSSATPRHLPTEQLIGKRIEYVYSATERYEHVYLNPRFYTWHCLSGSERGLADTDRCDTLEIAPQMYLFIWREKIVPTLGIVVVDLEQLRTTGKILGYRDFEFATITNFQVGARARIVSDVPP
jgi:hypothetical protein